MRTVRTSALAALLVATVLVPAGAARAQDAGVVRIAFVDVAEIFQKYKKARDIEQETRLELEKVDAELREKFEQIEEMRDELDLLVPGTTEYREKARQIDFEAFKLEYREKELKRTILENAVKKMNLVYTEIRRECENYARKNGLAAVLMYNAQEIEAKSLDELRVLIASRPVLYRDKGLDITEEILKSLG